MTIEIPIWLIWALGLTVGIPLVAIPLFCTVAFFVVYLGWGR